MSFVHRIDADGRMPDFIIAGMAKSGTSSLYHYLRRHPQVFVGRHRAVNFFGLGDQPLLQFAGPVREWRIHASTAAEMRALYRDAPADSRIGEGSSFFNFTPRAAQRIRCYAPDAKLIFLLRNPVERAFSQYRYARAMGWEPESRYRNALRQESQCLRTDWFPFLHYRASALYSQNLRVYYDLFSRAQIFVAMFEELRDDPGNLLRRLFEFLGIDASYRLLSTVNHNPTRVAEFPWFYSDCNLAASRLRRIMPGRALRFVLRSLRLLDRRPADAAVELFDVLEPEMIRADIEATQMLTGCDLSAWLRRFPSAGTR